MRARRADASRSAPPSSTSTSTTAEARALRIAELYLLQRRLEQQIDRVRAAYDGELIAARREQISYAVLGDALLVATGTPRTADALGRAEWVLRSATRKALRRRGVTGDHADTVVDDAKASDGDDMRRAPIMVREYWFEPPSTGLGGLDVGGEYDLDDLDERLRERERDPRDDRDDREYADNNRERDARNTHTREDR